MSDTSQSLPSQSIPSSELVEFVSKHLPKQTFTNPYLNCERTIRLVANIDENVYNSIYSIHPCRGTWQTLAALLIQKLHNELTKRNITSFTQQEQFEFFVANCELTLPGDARDERTDNSGGTSVPRSPTSRTSPSCETSPLPGRTPSRGVKDKTVTNSKSKLPSSIGRAGRKQKGEGSNIEGGA